MQWGAMRIALNYEILKSSVICCTTANLGEGIIVALDRQSGQLKSTSPGRHWLPYFVHTGCQCRRGRCRIHRHPRGRRRSAMIIPSPWIQTGFTTEYTSKRKSPTLQNWWIFLTTCLSRTDKVDLTQHCFETGFWGTCCVF